MKGILDMPIVSKVAFEDLLAVFGYGKPKSLTVFENDFGQYVKNAANDLAIKYLAIQNVKQKLNIIGSNFRDFLYFSTTSKQDRYFFILSTKRRGYMPIMVFRF